MGYQLQNIPPEKRSEIEMCWSIEKRCHTTAYLTAIFGGMFGIHRFYLGKDGGGLMMLSTWVAIILLVISIFKWIEVTTSLEEIEVIFGELGATHYQIVAADYEAVAAMAGISLLILFCIAAWLMFDLVQMHEYINTQNILIANEIVRHYDGIQRGDVDGDEIKHGEVYFKGKRYASIKEAAEKTGFSEYFVGKVGTDRSTTR